MKIAVIGSGIIGYMVSSYLTENGHQVDCISPTLKSASSSLNSTKKNYINYVGSVSPKYKRKDFKESKFVSDQYYPKTLSNFIGLEIIGEIGLAKYWGANLAIGGLIEDIKNLKLDKEEKNFISSKIPVLDVLDFYSEINNNNINPLKKFNKKDLDFEIKSSTLAIWKDKCDPEKMPDERKNQAIFGSDFNPLISYNKIDGYVEKINLKTNNNNNLSLDIFTKNITKNYIYDHIVIACGAIGSYRLITNSISDNKSIDLYSRIKHHPILVTICFAPKIKYPKNYISMSNFDIKINSKVGKLYMNYFPFRGAIKALFREKFELINKKKSLHFIKGIKRFIDNLPDFPIFPGWWINRMYVSNIYIPSDFTASFICKKNNKVHIIGGYRFDFEKVILRRVWLSIIYKLLKNKIFVILLKPKIVQTGGDMHYSSTLENYTNNKGQLIINNKILNNISVVDSSSSRNLPTPNPTYFFVARAIKLLRKFRA